MKLNILRWVAVAFGATLAVVPLVAHHSFDAEFDEKKPVKLNGVVTKYEWNNPHVFVYLDVTDKGSVKNWGVEFASITELKSAGWTRESVKVGDVITVEGSSARDGTNLVGGKSLTPAAGKKLSSVFSNMPAAPPKGVQAKATPKWPDGHPRLGVEPGQKGYWSNPSTGGLYETSAGNIRMTKDGLLLNIADAGKVAPFQPWAKGLYEYRQKSLLKDDPMVSCLPPSGPRQFQAAHGVQFVEQPDRQRIFVMSGGGNRNWRLIYLDGRAIPDSEDVSPTYFGYSSGKWEGDTLVVNVGVFSERFWFTNGGVPHTEGLKLIERFSRPDYNTLKYEVTVNDPAAYTRPWTGGWTLQWMANEDLDTQYFCQDNDRDPEHMVGPINVK
jgi:hypothetical protein